MAKQCPNCQQLLDEAARFCPICGTQVSEVKSLDAPLEFPEGQLPPPLIADQPPPTQTPSTPVPPPPLLTQLPSFTKPALLSGIILGVLSSLPVVNCCCLLWVCGAGMLSVYLLRTETTAEINAAAGAKLGFLTALFGVLFWTLFDIPLTFIVGTPDLSELQDVLKLPSETLETLERLTEQFSNPLNPLVLFFNVTIKLVICGALTTLGGVLGAAFWGQPKSS